MTRPAIYLDTNVVIRLMEYRDDEVRSLLADLHERQGVVVTSELTLAEALVFPIKDDDQSMISHYESFLTTSDGVVVVPVTRAILRKSAEIRADFGSRTPDSIHVATALEAECHFFLTSDRRIRTPEPLTILEIGQSSDWTGLE
ncbi:type II toxin-antitoxin system VapC family toxin [Jiella mangrovi]|uniref:Type II toxin-antitoxin system VapC family toxin n=1 Tax=Jiella mangrovi TaxID=2821407 RepID=A0ABS4BGW3_9HYPH|nr:type II toxin-antitoxin system VapC family toxin [Jiella mangrovi]MBP0615989.1 type II toxin-antitoxin system VapC family toxin [Jiella mangrovi]